MTSDLLCARGTRKFPAGRTGTQAGYSAHLNARETPCEACRAAHSSHRRVDYHQNRDQQLAQGKTYRANNPERYKQYARDKGVKMHGITPAIYMEILDAQNGGCAICGATEPGGNNVSFHIDHDHSCCPGIYACGDCVRGLLCNKCNLAIGLLRDNTELLHRAADYLSGWRAC